MGKNAFSYLEEHLKRTYNVLINANKPMTAEQLAKRMGIARSTAAYNLNRLVKLNFLEKFPGRTDENKRMMFFLPKFIYFEPSNNIRTIEKQNSGMRSFHCQIDNTKHPSTDPAYQCEICSRYVCASCFHEKMKIVGLNKCPMCNGNLVRIQ